MQAFTDFPFNGDLATKQHYFWMHQITCLTEMASFGYFGYSSIDVDVYDTGWYAWQGIGIIAFWVVKFYLFLNIYYVVRFSNPDDLRNKTALSNKLSGKSKGLTNHISNDTSQRRSPRSTGSSSYESGHRVCTPRSVFGRAGASGLTLHSSWLSSDDEEAARALDRANHNVQLHNLYIEIFSEIMRMVCAVFSTYMAFRTERFQIAWAFVGSWTFHIILRSMMDWYYDTLACRSRSNKIDMWRRMLILNFLQVRRIYEIRVAVKTTNIGTGLLTTRFVNGLFQSIAGAAFNIMMFYIIIEADFDSSDGITIAVMGIYAVGAVFDTLDSANVMFRFQPIMNPSVMLYPKGARMFVASDSILRVLVWSFFMSFCKSSIIPIVVAIATRWILFSIVYVQSGYIFPPLLIDDEYTDKISNRSKILWSLFPAGTFQAFTDIPFNGDLAQGRITAIVHQGISFCERAAFAVLGYYFVISDNVQLEVCWWGWYAIGIIIFSVVKLILFFAVYIRVRFPSKSCMDDIRRQQFIENFCFSSENDSCDPDSPKNLSTLVKFDAVEDVDSRKLSDVDRETPIGQIDWSLSSPIMLIVSGVKNLAI